METTVESVFCGTLINAKLASQLFKPQILNFHNNY